MGGEPLVKRFTRRDESDRNIRWLDLANMPTPERFAFDAYAAGHGTESEIQRMQIQLELLAFSPGGLGKYRYALKSILEQPRYSFETRKAEYAWYSYARRVFNAAVEAGNPEACAIVMLCSLAEFAKQCEKRRARIERAQARSPELRKAAAQKAVITRRRNSEMRVKFAETDKAIEDVFAAAEAMANAE